ncbi:DUF4157 domain-containing protein [Actinomadura yumaensis]|uniref:eCIS core domain-containing protein n=1 Tax=Actinomadura yumaensis TaxID=111807 RepID=UPI003610F5FB
MGHGTPHVRPTVVGPALEARLRAALGAGERLADRLTSAFERAYGAGLGELRVHTGPEADLACRALDADAFTAGADVFFRDGAYAPHTRAGLELLAHEVAHAVEQGRPTGVLARRARSCPVPATPARRAPTRWPARSRAASAEDCRAHAARPGRSVRRGVPCGGWAARSGSSSSGTRPGSTACSGTPRPPTSKRSPSGGRRASRS